MRSRRLAFFVVAMTVLAGVGAGAGTVFAAPPDGPPQAEVTHRPVCGPVPQGEARCHSELVLHQSKRPPKTTTTLATSSSSSSTPSTSSTSTSTTTSSSTTSTTRPTTTTTSQATTTTV